MSNQNIEVERQKEIEKEKREEECREANIAWYNLLHDQKVALINLIVTRNERLEINGRSVKDASHNQLIQEAKVLNWELDQEDRRIWKEYLSTSSRPRRKNGRYKIKKNTTSVRQWPDQ